MKTFELHVRPQTLIDVEELEIGEAFTVDHESEPLICIVEKRRELDVIVYVQEIHARWHFDFGEMVMPAERIREASNE